MGDTVDIPPHLDLAALESALREAEPAVMLLPTWLLENLIAADRGLAGPLFSIPHDRSHVVTRERLLELADDEDLPLPSEPPGEPRLILLARPDNDYLAQASAPQVLLSYWRLLFHAEIDAMLLARRAEPGFDHAAVQQRIERLGRAAFREATFVLHKEHALPSGADDADAYAEFAAAYLELLHFEPWMLHWYFPASDAQRVLAVLAEDVDAEDVLSRTRLPGAAEPAQEPVNDDDIAPDRAAASDFAEAPVFRSQSNRPKGKAMLKRAVGAEERGNDVRAALLRMRAARLLPAESGKLRNGAARRLDALAMRLRAALELDDADYDPWRAVLRGLLQRADVGWWNNERRLLYDLQKACVCHEREIYSANVVEWLLDRCKRPLRRPQPAQRLVNAHKALRSAEKRALKVQLHPHDQAALRRLLHAAVERAEHRLRTDLRPAVIHALEEGDLRPRGAVEHVAEEKLVDELLDDVVRRGYLNLGNLRDAVSRNQLKLNDLAGPTELFGRDQLLRADRKLELALDGVYHRGEFYLRLFQRLSSVLFGTPIGRLLTRVILIPFVGAYVVLEGLDHSVGLGLNKLAHVHVHFTHRVTLLLLGLFFMAVINWPTFRAAAVRGARLIARGLRTVFFDFPKWLGKLPLVRFLFTSQVARLLFRYAIKPLAISAIALPLLPDGLATGRRVVVLVAVYVVVTVLLNSPAGRAFEQTLLHALRVTLPRFTWDILVGLFRLVMNAFDRLLESVDRALYAVDEWLRFGTTQRRWIVAFKAVLGIVWFYVAYITRFVINLLVEPQINPIKHFPVVTVSHKIMIPLTKPVHDGLTIAGMTDATSWTVAGGIITGTPGIFGFLAWELKENWKLYRRNRPQVLRPVRVGSHGETFAQLLRPGFHSGTLPKIFARVRKSALRRRDDARRAGGPSTRDREAAHHLAEDVRKFAERELASLLNRHPLWANTPIEIGEVELAVTRIRIELLCDALGNGGAPAVLAFDQRDGYILASVEEPGWMPSLPPTQAELLRVALTGFYKIASVDIAAEQVQAAFSPAPVVLDVCHGKLVVWTSDRFDRETSYDLDGAATAESDDARRMLLRYVDVPWPLWRRVWDAQTASEIAEITGQIAPDVEVLPAGCPRRPDRPGAATRGFPVTPPHLPAPTLQTTT